MTVDEASHSDGNILNILRLMITIKADWCCSIFDAFWYNVNQMIRDRTCHQQCRQGGARLVLSHEVPPGSSPSSNHTRDALWQKRQNDQQKMQFLVKDIVKDVSKGFFFGRGPDVTSYDLWLWRRTPRYVSPGCCCRYTYGEASVPP